MVFSSIFFLFVFLASFLSINFLARKFSITIQNWVLLSFSVFFYYYGESLFIFIMIASASIDFYAAKMISRSYKKNPHKKPRLFLALSIASNLSILFYFKYCNFFIELFNYPLEQLGLQNIYFLEITLPLGISFYTFQSMSYTIDVYNKKVTTSKSYFQFLTFVSMFPQLIAGPIVRYRDVAKQLHKRHSTINDIHTGIHRFILGLSKKVLIANNVGYFADYFFTLPNHSLDSLGAWIGITCYTLQIYFDFSGYSDMAIGLGRMIGFTYPENFNYPYTAKSIQDFWRRWHITLSLWFRDYLYIPLGGNKLGKYRTYINQYLVFLLCGLWHGASLNFIAWGLYHGSFLTLEKIISPKSFYGSSLLRHIYVLIVIMVGWVFFRTESLSQSIFYLEKMFSFSKIAPSSLAVLGQNQLLFSVGAGILFATPIYKKYQKYFEKNLSFVSLLLFVLCTAFLVESEYNPFIYFRF